MIRPHHPLATVRNLAAQRPAAGPRWAAAACLALLAVSPMLSVYAQNTPAAQRRQPVSIEELGERAATPEGLRGTMHGANPRLGTYVFTWWDPESFFLSQNLSLAPGGPEVNAALAALERHQEVRIRGRLVRTGTTQAHLVVEACEPGKKWDPGVRAVEPLERPEGLEKWLKGRKRVPAMVHALSEDGSMLAIELRGEVVPVQVMEPAQREAVKQLYRGDRIEVRYRVAERPARPVHLVLTPGKGEDEPALKVLDAIQAQHEQERTLEGNLVLFPRSPALRRSIWGVEERGPNGLHRYFTIFNFQDLKDQGKIDALLQGAWSGNPDGVRDGRNKYVHTRVRVRVTGKVSNPAANQANPTLVTTSEQVTLAAPGPSSRAGRAD